MVVARTAVLLAVLLAAKLAPSLAARTAREAQPCESDWLLGDLGGDDHVVGNHLDDDCLSTAHRLDELPGLLRCRRGIKTVGMDQRHGGSHSRPDDHKPRAARGGRAPRRALWGDEPSGPVRPARLPRPRPPKLVASRPPAPARTAWGGIAGRPLLPVDTDEGPAFQMPRPAAHPTSRGWNPFSVEPERHVTRTGILLPPYLPEDVIAAPATGVATAEDRPDNPAVLRSPRRIEHRSPEAPPPSPPPPPSSPPPTSSRSSSGRARAASVEQELRKAWENIAAHRVDIPVSSNNNNIKIKVKVSSAQALNSQQHQQQPKAKQQQQRTRTLHQDEEEGRMLAELLYRLARRAEEISARLEHLANTATRRVSSGARWDAVPTRTAPRRASGASNRASAVITKAASSAASNAARRSSQSSARGSSVEQQSTPRKRGWRRDQYAETPPHGQRRACE